MKDFQGDINNPISNLVSEALRNIKSYIDMDTIIGDALSMGNGVVAYPVLKISLGIVSGGGQYTNKLIIKKTKENFPFAGGSGVGFSVEPIGFLIVSKGKQELITIKQENAWANVMEKVGQAFGDYLKQVGKKEIKKDIKNEKN